MSNNLQFNDNGTYTKTYIGSDSTGFYNMYYDGNTITSTTLLMGTGHRINFQIDPKKLPKYSQINSIKLRLRGTNNLTTPVINLTKETAYNSNTGTVIDCMVRAENFLYEVDVTKHVLDNEGNITYFGINTSHSISFYSSLTSTSSYLPQIIIDYVDIEQGLLKNKFVSGNAGRALEYKVGIQSGYPLISKELLNLGGNLMPLNLRLCFDTLRKAQNTVNALYNGMPNGWRLNYGMYLEGATNNYQFFDENGVRHQFKSSINDSSIHYDVAGTGLILIVETNGYKIKDTENNYLQFNSNKLLTKIARVIGTNEISTTITYNANTAQIATITDGMGRVFNFTYTSTEVKVTGTDITEIILSISNNQLTQIKEYGNRVSTYSYTNNFLTSAISDAGEKVIFTYDNLEKVSNISNYVNNNIVDQISLEYYLKTSYATNYKGIKFGYNFDIDSEVLSQFELQGKAAKNYKVLTKTDYSLLAEKSNTEAFNGYSDVELTSADGEVVLTKSLAKSKGTFDINTTGIYVVAFNYYIEGGYASKTSLLDVQQDGVSLLGTPISLNANNNKDQMILTSFRCNSLSAIKIKVTHSSEGTLYVNNIRVYESDPVEQYVCLNKYTNYSTISGDSQSWYKMNNNVTIGYDNGSDRFKVYKEDLEENLKNVALANGGKFNLWYNKKRGLITNVTSSILYTTSGPYYNLIELKMAVVTITKDKTTFRYNDYSSYGSLTNFLRRIIVHTSFLGELYEDFLVQNKDYLTVREKEYTSLYRDISHDSKGNETSSYVRNLNDALYINSAKKHSTDGKKLVSHKAYNGNLTYTGSTFDIDDNGKLKTEVLANGLTVSYDYDAEDNLKLKSATVSNVENKNEMEYEKDKAKQFSSSSNGYQFEYDTLNKLSKVKMIANDVVTDLITVQNSISPTNDVSIKAYPNGYYEKVTKDKYGNIMKIENSTNGSSYSIYKSFFHSDGDPESFKYSTDPETASLNQSALSRVRKVYDGITYDSATITYDNFGNVIKIAHTSESNIDNRTFAYDTAKRLKNDTILNGLTKYVVDYTYRNTDLEPSEDVEKVENAVSWTYDGTRNEQIIEKTNTVDNLRRVSSDKIYSNNYILQRDYTYATSGSNTTPFITKIDYKTGYYASPTSLGTIMYTYDNMNNITGVSDTFCSNTASYTYDGLGRITRENNSKLNKSSIWTYDSRGNITSQQDGVYTTGTFTPSTTTTFTYASSYPDRLTKHGSASITYDSMGNMLTYGSQRFSWTRGRILNSFTNASGSQYTYAYNADGMRTRKTLSTNVYTSYVVEGDKLISEHRKTDSAEIDLDYIYAGDEMIGFIYKTYVIFFIKNAQGDIIGLKDNSNNIRAKYVYDAWGNHKVYNASGVEQTSSTFVGNINPIRYRGYYYDTESDMYYCKSRYYKPQINRWINMDDISYLDKKNINGFNLYAYCGNDPVNKYDPSGHIAISTIIGIIIGVVALAATANDIYQIARGEDNGEGLKVMISGDNVHVKNSYKILTPWMRYGYSFYLNHFNHNTKDVIQGSTAGVQFEWELHNYAAWLGIGGDSAKHLDVGKSIFADGKTHPLRDEHGNITATGVMSLGMRIVYIWFGNPIYWIWDLIVNGGF